MNIFEQLEKQEKDLDQMEAMTKENEKLVQESFKKIKIARVLLNELKAMIVMMTIVNPPKVINNDLVN